MSKRKGQLSVPLDPASRQFVEREAEREDRTVISACCAAEFRPG